MSKKYILIFPFLFTLSSYLYSQSGCTDTQAINFDENALENDGSCIYPQTNYQPILLTNLNNDLDEASGLAIFDNDLWIQNDGGNANNIYKVDSLSGEITHTLELTNADNEDWEDLAQNDTHLFIGDFGNNEGDRTDLRIYRVNKNALTENSALTGFIDFSYEDQVDFSENQNNHNYDCEAFFYHNDSLHLFTKNWLDNTCKYYVIPDEAGDHSAELRATFNTDGLITGAAIAPDGTVALVGYTQGGATFMWLLFDYKEGNFFSGNRRRINFGSAINTSQLEAVVFQKNGYGYLASEVFSILPPKLLAFNSKQWTDPITAVSESPKVLSNIQLSPNPVVQDLNLIFEEALSGNLELKIFNTLGQQILVKQWTLFNQSSLLIDQIENLPSGNYWIVGQYKQYSFNVFFNKI